MIKTNYHTHSTYCDGKNTLEEMVLSAIQKKIDILGFSGHAMYPFSSSWHIPVNSINDYVKECSLLKEKYQDKITILTGFEADYVPGITIPSIDNYREFNPDFLIGSVHFVYSENGTFGVDESAEEVNENLQKVYNGNAKELVCRYFEAQREMLKKRNFQIIGHPDLIRKNNGILKLFSEQEEWYKEQVKLTAKAISQAGVIAEINTGAIARKKMNDVYPSSYFLELLKSQNVPVTINSDCHNAPDLDCAFDFAIKAALKAGYTETAYIDGERNIKFQKIE